MTGTSYGLVDTHAHLDDDQFAGNVGAVLERATGSGVNAVINIGYRPDRWRTTLDLASRYPMMVCTFGLHPHHAEEWSPSVETELIGLLNERNPVAIGEIGLDYYRNFNPPEVQRGVFIRQLEIAEEIGLPVVIHQRHAEQDLMHVLAELPAKVVCVLHSFDGSVDLADMAIERGYFIGVGGLMTRAGSGELRDVLKRVPLDRMLVETDSPYLVPSGIKNRRNEPANVARVVEILAELLMTSPKTIAESTSRNAVRAFGKQIATRIETSAVTEVSS